MPKKIIKETNMCKNKGKSWLSIIFFKCYRKSLACIKFELENSKGDFFSDLKKRESGSSKDTEQNHSK